MSELKTKFGIGDVVYRATTVQVSKQHACPDCLGSKKWQATSPAGTEYTFDCPRCSAQCGPHDPLSLKYVERGPHVQRLTIGSIRVDTNDERPNSYMAVETGVGCGSIYNESDLFATEEEATTVAKLRAARETTETDWIATLYNKTLALSGYQLQNAERVAARDARISFEVAAENLLNDLDECETHGDVRAHVQRFKKGISA